MILMLTRGATFDIVCPEDPADLKWQGSDNVKNGTSTAGGPTGPEREKVGFRGRVGGKFEIRNPKFPREGWVGTQNSKLRTQH
jgi:hypothetical protein